MGLVGSVTVIEVGGAEVDAGTVKGSEGSPVQMGGEGSSV